MANFVILVTILAFIFTIQEKLIFSRSINVNNIINDLELLINDLKEENSNEFSSSAINNIDTNNIQSIENSLIKGDVNQSQEGQLEGYADVSSESIENSTPVEAIPDTIPEIVSANAEPENVAPENTTSENVVPEMVMPENNSPANVAPENIQSDNSALVEDTPQNNSELSESTLNLTPLENQFTEIPVQNISDDAELQNAIVADDASSELVVPVEGMNPDELNKPSGHEEEKTNAFIDSSIPLELDDFDIDEMEEEQNEIPSNDEFEDEFEEALYGIN